MRPFSIWYLVPSIVLAAACSKPAAKPAEAPPPDTTAAVAPAASSGPQAILTVIYNPPKDSTAFEPYYSATHVPLVVLGQQEIGFKRADLTKFASNFDGSAPAKYRRAELCFPSMDALKKGTATPAFKQVGDDLPKFATGGLAALIGEQQ